MANDIGQGTTISFGGILTNSSNSSTYRVNGINWGGISREVVDASHMLTSGGKEFLASENYDPGEISVEIHFDPSISPIPTMTNVSTTQIVAVRFANGGTNTALWSAYGFLSQFEAGAPKDDMMTGTVTIKLSGNIG
jgi:hypothetical protein